MKNAVHKKIAVVGSFAESLVNFRGPLISAMIERGHLVVACAPDASPELAATLRAMGAEYKDISFHRTSLNPFQDLRTLLSMLRFFKQERPDLVMSYTIKPVIYGSVAARLTGVPGIFSMIEGLGHAFSTDSLKQRLVATVARLLYGAALAGNRKVFFVNPDDIAFFKGSGMLRDSDRAILINGAGLDVDYYRPMPLPKSVSFLFMARFLRQKGLCEYVDAARVIRRQHPDVRFSLVGWIDSHPDAILEKELRAWENEGVIDYVGRLTDVRPAMASCSVYVLPSYYREGLPRTSLEAMATGRAIITTDMPGCRETVRDGWNGLLVPPRDPTALVAAMKKLISDPGLIAEMGRRSRELAVEKFDVNKVNAVILKAMEL